MKKYFFSFVVLLILSLLMNNQAYTLGSLESIFNSLSLKKRTDDPDTATGEGKIYYRGAIAGGIDDDTVLMLHMDGSDEGTVFTDASDTPHTVTANGDANTEDSEKKFGGTSAEFDGTGDYLTIPDSSDWDFGNGDFTIEAWIYTSQTGDQEIVMQDSPSWRWNLRLSTGGYAKFQGNGGTDWNITGTTVISDSAWHHVMGVRNGNAQYLFVDGTKEGTDGSFSGTISDLNVGIMVGAHENRTGDQWNGYLDELRISKGIARWTSNFTPPTKSYVSSSNEGLYFKDENGTVVPIIEILP
ncbi:MAG TPA: LamG domain-containing protein [Nitrospinota bacterium]|nr:LamG domain-containing protein [Nitrospinota bacterium]|tara:strand:+ start:2095 stop:2991 length:897 start_codon:yes stop_codon:yes gene_type:complete